MAKGLRFALMVVWATGLGGQSTGDPDEALREVRAKLHRLTQRLPRYTCVQTVERRYFRLKNDKAHASSCDQVMGDRASGRTKLQLYATDRLRLDVAVADGHEIASWAGAGKFDARSVDEIVGEGPTATGAFGLHLVDVFDNAGVHFEHLGEKTVGGRSVFEYRFTVPIDASNYKVRGGTNWHFTDYDGTFQIDSQTFDLERLSIRTDELPPDTGMCEARSALEYQHLKIGEGDFLLPRESRLEIVQTDARETANITTFASCREYHAESTLRFEEEPSVGGGEGKAATGSAPLVLPAGLEVSMALTAPIDTSTAAAGDPVTARVTRAVHDPKAKGILIPAGSLARGRITRMRHRVGGPDDFVILIAFETLEVNRVASPFFVKLDQLDQFDRLRIRLGERRGMMGAASRAAANQGPESWGALIFPSARDRYVVSAGFEAKWLTVAPPAAQ